MSRMKRKIKGTIFIFSNEKKWQTIITRMTIEMNPLLDTRFLVLLCPSVMPWILKQTGLETFKKKYFYDWRHLVKDHIPKIAKHIFFGLFG